MIESIWWNICYTYLLAKYLLVKYVLENFYIAITEIILRGWFSKKCLASTALRLHQRCLVDLHSAFIPSTVESTLAKKTKNTCTRKNLSLLRARECHFIIAIVLPWDFLNSSSTCVVWYKSVTRESFSFQKFCEQLCSKLNFFAAFVNSAIDSIWDMKWSMINKMFFLIKIFYSRNQYWNIFLG